VEAWWDAGAAAGHGAVVARRGGRIESLHVVEVWAVDAVGAGRGTTTGARRLPVFLRSAAKPLQAMAAVEAGVLDPLGLDDRHLAVGCASHTSTDEHVGLVAEILEAAGLGAGDLRCGVTAPLEARVADDLAARGVPPGPLHHNCSGNHALALAACVVAGWPTTDYLTADHPVQQAMRRAVARAVVGFADHVGEGPDNCGMRAYRLPLEAAAGAFGRLASGALGDAGARVAGAMTAHPRLVYGSQGVDTVLMESSPGLVAKVGAESVFVAGRPDGAGLAAKVVDGARRALDPAAVAAAAAGLGVTAIGPEAERLSRPPIVDARGGVIGHLEAEIRLAASRSA
jgi:L-asparaginase II